MITKDYFKDGDGYKFAGQHLIVDVWRANNSHDAQHIENMFVECVEVSGATLLHIHTHQFSDNGGISGVVVLAESHISIHTWPEKHYVALDIFMCGNANPHKCLAVIKKYFGADCQLVVNEQKRGLMIK